MYSRFGIDIERINLDPHGDLDLTDEARADMALAVSNLYADHAERVLNSWCSDGEFAVFPNGDIHVNIDAYLAPLEDNWESASDEIAMGPDAQEIDALIDKYVAVTQETTQTGIPVVDCDQCGMRHPATRQHCARCGEGHIFIDSACSVPVEAEETATAVHITSPRLVANGVGAWSGTTDDYDADMLQHDGRFHQAVLDKATEGVFGEGVADMIESQLPMIESQLPETLSEVARALSREEFAEFCEHLFDDPNVTLG